MNIDAARDDLAFMRALVQPDQRWQRGFGESYLAAGLCYGGQILMHGAQALGWAPSEGPVALAIGFGPTVVFLGLLFWILGRNRSEPGGITARAVGSVFGAAGLANIVMIVIIGFVAWRQHSFIIWLIYPCMTIVLQGLAWLVAYALRRRGWFAVVAVGWFATAVGMGFSIEHIGVYLGILGLGFLVLMVVPGALMMRQARAAA